VGFPSFILFTWWFPLLFLVRIFEVSSPVTVTQDGIKTRQEDGMHHWLFVIKSHHWLSARI
jgi:hypothetical protein